MKSGGMEEKTVSHPGDFCCAISMELMEDPVFIVSVDPNDDTKFICSGRCYDRKNIEKMMRIQGELYDPGSGQKGLKNPFLVSNLTMKNTIEAYKRGETATPMSEPVIYVYRGADGDIYYGEKSYEKRSFNDEVINEYHLTLISNLFLPIESDPQKKAELDAAAEKTAHEMPYDANLDNAKSIPSENAHSWLASVKSITDSPVIRTILFGLGLAAAWRFLFSSGTRNQPQTPLPLSADGLICEPQRGTMAMVQAQLAETAQWDIPDKFTIIESNLEYKEGEVILSQAIEALMHEAPILHGMYIDLQQSEAERLHFTIVPDHEPPVEFSPEKHEICISARLLETSEASPEQRKKLLDGLAYSICQSYEPLSIMENEGANLKIHARDVFIKDFKMLSLIIKLTASDAKRWTKREESFIQDLLEEMRRYGGTPVDDNCDPVAMLHTTAKTILQRRKENEPMEYKPNDAACRLLMRIRREGAFQLGSAVSNIRQFYWTGKESAAREAMKTVIARESTENTASRKQ